MVRVYVSVGSNIERKKNIRAAVKALHRCFGRLTLSSVYENRPIGFDGENFYNLVAGFDSNEPPESVNAILHAIEQQLGRVRKASRFSSRSIDLDLLLYGDRIQHDAVLRLPHPDILDYACVLRPLAELVPNNRHPLSGESFIELWKKFAQSTQPLTPVSLELNDVNPRS